MEPEEQQLAFRILVIGGHNSGRSVMAEAMLRALELPGLEVESAGVATGERDPFTVEAMTEIGLDVSGHTGRALAALGAGSYDLIITVCKTAREYREQMIRTLPGDVQCPLGKVPLIVGAPFHLDWFVADPAAAEGTPEQRREAYRRVRDELRGYVDALTRHGYLAIFKTQRLTLQHLIDSLEEGIMAHDDSGHIYLFNQAAERITGYSRDEVLGRHCHHVFAPDGLCGMMCARDRGEVPSQSSLQEYQVRFVNRDGEERRLKMLVKPVLDGPGRSTGVVMTIRDVTEVSELRWQLGERHSFRGMVGRSAQMRSVFETIRQVAGSDYPILITGESGTGKELVARAIHQESRRAGGPFIAVNCGALPEPILESELFGHVRGAFTGAVRDKKGRFELAARGTLLLDEVGELTPAFQVKLLRVLQEKRFELVGGERSVSSDVRILSATNRDLKRMVRDGTFREDLFYRLCVVPITLPPLRERHEDLVTLIEKLLEDIRQETGKQIARIASPAMDLLLAYPWPGNVRELINTLQAASLLCRGDEILAEHLPPEVRQGGPLPLAAAQLPRQIGLPTVAAQRRGKLERGAVERALTATNGNKLQAAKLLRVGRATLYRFLEREGIA